MKTTALELHWKVNTLKHSQMILFSRVSQFILLCTHCVRPGGWAYKVVLIRMVPAGKFSVGEWFIL